MNAAPARNPYTQDDRSQENPSAAVDSLSFMRSVYQWMAIGLMLTGVVAAFVASRPDLYSVILRGPLFMGIIIAELIMVVVFSRSVRKVSFATAATMFISYCALSGLTFSVFLLRYDVHSLALAFYATGGMFAAMTAYGTLTKNDLTSWGSIFFMGLIGVIIAGLLNFFFQSSLLDMAISVVSVFVFTGLTAYDTQKIRALSASGDKRLALAGALELYLDFVNLFIALLRLFGRRR